jgi:hypothetical protein
VKKKKKSRHFFEYFDLFVVYTYICSQNFLQNSNIPTISHKKKATVFGSLRLFACRETAIAGERQAGE